MSEQVPFEPTPQEVSADDPSILGGNVTPPFDDELYEQKVEFLEGYLQKETETDLAAQRLALVKAVGGDRAVERVNVWEIVKESEARRAYNGVYRILAEQSPSVIKPEEQKDIFDKVISRISLDMRGTTSYAGADVVDASAGRNLDGLVETDQLQDPAVLAKATETIRLLVTTGQYKLHKWGDASQLETALELIETYTEWVAGFDLKKAGLDEARSSLTIALAALQLDNTTKPTYKYSMPERRYLFAKTTDGLRRLRRSEVHAFLWRQDFDLPQPVAEQPETN